MCGVLNAILQSCSNQPKIIHPIFHDSTSLDAIGGDPDPGRSRRSLYPHRSRATDDHSTRVFKLIDRPNFPIWRWFTAPIEVLGSEDGLTIITIILFLLMVGASFAVLQKCGIVQSVVQAIIGKFGKQKYILLLIISLFFMILGGFFGIFEETVPMVPFNGGAGNPPWLGF